MIIAARAHAPPDLDLPPRETLCRMRQWLKKRLLELLLSVRAYDYEA